ncbi:MAG: hypothetical protein EON88_27185 [Brevundimonas sp.]|nr:MAG: hypothetical protein EON88_27185 [Brevundimonas sp.]
MLILSLAGCSPDAPAPEQSSSPRPAASPGVLLQQPCEAGRLSARNIENMMHSPEGFDVAVESFLADGRYHALSGAGTAVRGTYSVCGDQVCVEGRCRPLVVLADGHILLEGKRLQRIVETPRAAEPLWSRKPDSGQILERYPPEALASGVSGRVTLRCRPRANGALGDCESLSETPPGKGFAAAALGLAPYHRLNPREVHDLSSEDQTLTFDMTFEPPLNPASPPR